MLRDRIQIEILFVSLVVT